MTAEITRNIWEQMLPDQHVESFRNYYIVSDVKETWKGNNSLQVSFAIRSKSDVELNYVYAYDGVAHDILQTKLSKWSCVTVEACVKKRKGKEGYKKFLKATSVVIAGPSLIADEPQRNPEPYTPDVPADYYPRQNSFNTNYNHRKNFYPDEYREPEFPRYQSNYQFTNPGSSHHIPHVEEEFLEIPKRK